MDYEGKVKVSLMLDPKVMVPTQCPYSLQTVMNDFLLCRKDHYTVHVIYRGSEKWILRNDKAVFVLDEPRTKKKPIPKLHMFFFITGYTVNPFS